MLIHRGPWCMNKYFGWIDYCVPPCTFIMKMCVSLQKTKRLDNYFYILVLYDMLREFVVSKYLCSTGIFLYDILLEFVSSKFFLSAGIFWY